MTPTPNQSRDLAQFAADLHNQVQAKVGGDMADTDGGKHLLREELFTEEVLELLEEHDEVTGW